MFKQEQLQFGRFAFLTLLLIMLLAVAGCESESDDIPTGPAETVDYMVHQAWGYLDAGEIDNAIEEFNRAANAEATNLEAYLGLGYAYSKNNELVRAQLNFSNVIGLVDVLLLDPENPITQEYADTLLAEAYAGRTAAYLAALSYQDAITNAALCIDIWSGFSDPSHRWLEGVNLHDVRVMKANAHYGAQEFNLCMLIVDDLMDGDFITGSDQVISNTETLEVTLLQDTHVNGIAALELTNYNLIHPASIEDTAGNVAVITGFDGAGNTIRFRANPIPAQGDQYTVVYMYAADFGLFMVELREALTDLE